MDENTRKAAAFWSNHQTSRKRRWWEFPAVIQHINRLVCGEPLDKMSAGLLRHLTALAPGGQFRKAISVGCGNCGKELSLLKQGLVQKIDAFEISATRIEQGRASAQKAGLTDRITFTVGDVFQMNIPTDYDLVYWNNSLHHMPDVEAALVWSRQRLVPGGCLGMDDFVGPSLFQWSEMNLMVATRVRKLLPERLLHNPEAPGYLLPTVMMRPDIRQHLAADPSEAADSSRILPALRQVFPGVQIVLTGGCVYHLALNDVLANFDPQTDGTLLDSLLLADELMAAGGETHYAAAWAVK